MDTTPPNFTAPDLTNDQQHFERNRYRSTMPSNPRYTQTPRSNPAISRLNKQNQNCPSPSSSCVSTDTTYAQPWKSNKPDYEQPSLPKFRRYSSMSAKKGDEGGGKEEKNGGGRAIINFVQFRKSIMKPFKGNSKKGKETDGKRVENVPTSVTPIVIGSPPRRPIQQEEKLKMFRKVGMKQSMKVSAVQRMQKERQRDFQLVNENPQSNVKRRTDDTYAQIDSMLVFSSPPQNHHDEISLNDDDVEVVIKNSKTGKLATRKEMASSRKKINELPMTSTPKSFTNKPIQESLNVSNMSNSSLCVVDDATMKNNEKNNTIYYSTTALESEDVNREDVAKVDQANQYSSISKPKTKSVKSEPIDCTYEAQQPSHSQCPSVSGESPDLPFFGSYSSQMQLMQPPTVQQRVEEPSDVMMKEFWRVSRELKQQNEVLQFRRVTHQNLVQRMREVVQVKLTVLESGGNEPTQDMLQTVWKNCQEEEILKKRMLESEDLLFQSTLSIQNLEHRKNMLLECDDPVIHHAQ